MRRFLEAWALWVAGAAAALGAVYYLTRRLYAEAEELEDEG